MYGTDKYDVELLDDVELVVVEDDPDDGNLILHGSHQLEACHLIAAVAYAGNNHLVGVSTLHTDATVGMAGHRAEAAGILIALVARQFQIGTQPQHV